MIRKRPLLRPGIPSPYSNVNHQKYVYITAQTPFMSAINRVRRLLDLASKRTDAHLTTSELEKTSNVVALIKEKTRRPPEEVCVKGTGKAIDKVMNLALWLQNQEIYKVRICTGSVGAIDDVEDTEQVEDSGSRAQIRMVSTLEVFVSYKS